MTGSSYVNTFLRIAKGNGMIRSMKRAISATRSRKTCGYGQLDPDTHMGVGLLSGSPGPEDAERGGRRGHTKV